MLIVALMDSFEMNREEQSRLLGQKQHELEVSVVVVVVPHV